MKWQEGWLDLEQWARNSVDMVPHTAQLTELARGCKLIVEFGVRSGVSTLALLMGLPDEGRLVSVDSDPTVPDIAHPALLADPRWTFMLGRDLNPDVMLKLPGLPDLVMIDSSHEYEHTLAELDVANWLCAERIAMHDYLYEQPVCQVRRAADRWLESAPYEIEVLHESRWGLLVLRRKLYE